MVSQFLIQFGEITGRDLIHLESGLDGDNSDLLNLICHHYLPYMVFGLIYTDAISLWTHETTIYLRVPDLAIVKDIFIVEDMC